MDTYAYLLLCAFLGLVFALIFWHRKDLRQKFLFMGFVGGVAGVMSGFWYLQDYWQPPVIFRAGFFSFEDFLFGFMIAGISATLSECLFDNHKVRSYESRKKAIFGMFVLGLFILLFFVNFF